MRKYRTVWFFNGYYVFARAQDPHIHSVLQTQLKVSESAATPTLLKE
jgi:hypothetical protein